MQTHLRCNITHKHFSVINSTQSYAYENLGLIYDNKWYLITASEQISGFGVNGKWISPQNKNIYATFMFASNLQNCKAILEMSELASLSVYQTLEHFNIVSSIKWPNDVLVNHKKISGSIVEVFEVKNKEFTNISIIGIGLNVNMNLEEVKLINQKATSMKIESNNMNHIVDEVLEVLKEKLCSNILEYFKNGFYNFIDIIEARLLYKDSYLCIKQLEEEVCGILLGLGNGGSILLENDSKCYQLYYGRIIKDPVDI